MKKEKTVLNVIGIGKITILRINAMVLICGNHVMNLLKSEVADSE